MDHYKTLGIEKNADQQTIRKTYRQLATQYHPDKNPETAEKFKEIQKAYEILSDTEKRKQYDQFGENPPPPFVNMFGNVFGGGMFPDFLANMMGGMRFNNNNEPEILNIEVPSTLFELYSGCTKKVKVERKTFCKECSTTLETCRTCNGTGIITIQRQLNPMMIQQFQKKCDKCINGKVSFSTKECDICQKKGFYMDKHTIKVEIKQGHSYGHVYTFEKEGNEGLDGNKGNVNLRLVPSEDSEYSVYKLANGGKDLYLELEISLGNALCGLERRVKFVDGAYIVLKSKQGEVIEPDLIKVINGMGMPVDNNGGFGNLIIKFKVKFPKFIKVKGKILEKVKRLIDTQRPSEVRAEYGMSIDEHTEENSLNSDDKIIYLSDMGNMENEEDDESVKQCPVM